MIKTKEDLERYMKQDRVQLGINRKYPRFFSDEIWKYQIILRKYEYYMNNSNNIVMKLIKNFYKLRWHRKSVKYGVFVPPNVCDEGLSIAHMPGIIINDQAKIGKNVRIHEGVTIGASGGEAPIVKDECFLSSGCKVIGNITIERKCVIGAGAVVVKSIKESGITVAGVPAKKISNNSSERLVYWYKRR